MDATRWCALLNILICFTDFSGSLAMDKNDDVLGNAGLTLTVEHAIDTGQELLFQPRGLITIKNMKGTFGSYHDDEDISSTELESLKTAAAKANFYHIRVTWQRESEDGKKDLMYLSTFIKACSLLQSNLSDIIKLHVDSTGHVFAVGLSTTTADCSNFRTDPIAFRSLQRYNTTVILSQVMPGPAPDTQTYIKKLEDERRAKERGKGKDNRSFLAKYWMYIVPLVLFLMMSGQEAAPAAGGGDGGGGGGGGGN